MGRPRAGWNANFASLAKRTQLRHVAPVAPRRTLGLGSRLNESNRISSAVADEARVGASRPRLFPPLLAAMFAGTLLLNTFHAIPHLIAADFNLSVAVVTQALTIDTAVSILAALVIAPMSDRIGRRGMLLASMVISAGGGVLIATAPAFSVAAVGFALFGIGRGVTFPLLFGTVADVYAHPRRDPRMAALLAVSRTAFILAPITAGFVASALSWRAAFGVATAVMVVAALVVAVRTRREMRMQPPARTGVNPITDGLRAVLRSRELRVLLASNVAFAMGGMASLAFVGAYVAGEFGLRPHEAGLVLAAGSVAAGAGALVSMRLTLRHRLPVSVAAGLVLAGGLLGAFVLAGSVPLVVVAFVAGAFGYGLRDTPMRSLMLDGAPGHLGTISGLIQVSLSAGLLLGASFGGLLLGVAGFRAVGWLLAVAVLLGTLMLARAARSTAGGRSTRSRAVAPNSPGGPN